MNVKWSYKLVESSIACIAGGALSGGRHGAKVLSRAEVMAQTISHPGCTPRYTQSNVEPPKLPLFLFLQTPLLRGHPLFVNTSFCDPFSVSKSIKIILILSLWVCLRLHVFLYILSERKPHLANWRRIDAFASNFICWQL